MAPFTFAANMFGFVLAVRLSEHMAKALLASWTVIRVQNGLMRCLMMCKYGNSCHQR